VGAGGLGHLRQDLRRIATPEHEAAEALLQRREAVVQPPAAGGAERSALILVENVERHDRPALGRCRERRIVADAQILSKPDDRGHAPSAAVLEARGSTKMARYGAVVVGPSRAAFRHMGGARQGAGSWKRPKRISRCGGSAASSTRFTRAPFRIRMTT